MGTFANSEEPDEMLLFVNVIIIKHHKHDFMSGGFKWPELHTV